MIHNNGRRRLLQWGAATSALVLLNKAAFPQQKNFIVTAAQTEGPFYPDVDQNDKDADLTQVLGSEKTAQGTVIVVEGQIVDTTGSRLENVLVDIWQANSLGRYRHRKDPNHAPLDPNFQGWAQIFTKTNGLYHFKTILPGSYPAAPDWTRPPHIHFKVMKKGYRELTTQMYFPNHPLNKQDLILQSLPDSQARTVIADEVNNCRKNDDCVPTYKFNIVLSKI